MKKEDNLKSQPHWRCRLCQHRSSISAAICENPNCQADLTIYGEIIIPQNTDNKKKKDFWKDEDQDDDDQKPPRKPIHKGWAAGILAVLLTAGAGTGWFLMQGRTAEPGQMPETAEPGYTQPAPEPPVSEGSSAPEVSWTDNLLAGDPCSQRLSDSPEYPVFGSQLQRQSVGSVTFLDALPPQLPEDHWDVSATEDGSVLAWTEYDDSTGLYDLLIGAEGGMTAPEDCSGMFNGYTQMREISFNGAFHADRVLTMENMFYGCQELTVCDLSGLSAPVLTSMEGLFYDCDHLTSVSTAGMSCPALATARSMFWQCNALLEADLSGLNDASLEDTAWMFGHCTSLETLDVSFFDTSRVADMQGMFAACESLTAVDVSQFDTSRVTNMAGMFTGCAGLTELDVGGFDTSRVTDMSNMFHGCAGLTELNVAGWDTSCLERVNRMFYQCTNLAEPDIGGWDISKVTEYEEFADGTAFFYLKVMFSLSGLPAHTDFDGVG